MKKVFLFISLVSFVKTGFTQAEYSSFTSTGRGGATTFATDYQAVGINPANLGWSWDFEGKKVAWGLTESSYSLYSEALSKQQLRDMVKGMIKGNAADFTRTEKIQAARDFTESGFSFNADIGSFGIAFTGKKLGGIGFRVNDRFQWNSTFGKTAADILFLGYNADYFDSLTVANQFGDTSTVANSEDWSSDSLSVVNGFANSPKLISEIMNGSQMKMSWMREWNLSYGRKLFEADSTFALYAGVGIKFFQGLGYLDIRSENNQMEAFSALSPIFGIDYGTAGENNPSAVSGTGMKPVGHGFGFDFGVNVVLLNKIKLGVAVTNIGSMTWDGNVYTVKDTLLFDTKNAGLENYNIFTQMGEILGDNGLFKYDGLTSKTVKLPTALRMGASMKLGKKIELGTDIIMPMNDEAANFNKAIIGFGGDVQPIKWLKLQAGFMTGGNYDFQIPIGITFIAKNGTYEAGFASRDAITFFSQNGPTLSLSMGFIRWRL